MRLTSVIAIAALLTLGAGAAAQTLTGTVKNGTTGKPSRGNDVVLIRLGQGMEEAARTKTDAGGRFSFNLSEGGPHLVRAIHQGVTYHQIAPPGTSSVDVTVYDVGRKVEGIRVTADVMRFQAQGDEVQGIRLFAVNNTSSPPRTQMSDANFDFFLPPGAEVDQPMAMTAGGQPLKSAPVPQKEKNRYSFVFPLRPGETELQVGFHMPYGGQLSVDPKPVYASQHFVVMLPASMQFKGGPGAAFQAMKDPRQSDAVVQVASNTQVGDPLAFTISGTGTLGASQESEQESAGATQSSAPGSSRDSRPGGGLGPPIDAPDPLERYRWYILGGFAAVLSAGGIYVSNRSGAAPAFAIGEAEPPTPGGPPSRAADTSRPALLLEALKEELFQLEVDHQRGNISQAEYEKAKDALDQTLARALKRAGAK